MFSKAEVKELILKSGKRWLFPDFTNKLTWLVVTLGSTIILTPTPLKLIIYNWLVETANLNSGNKFILAELQASSADYIVGLSLIGFALAHNITNKYITYKENQGAKSDQEAYADVDRELFHIFLTDFPSGSRSTRLLREHDFGNSYHEGNTREIDNFVDSWDTAEREFLDAELEAKRRELWETCHVFLYKLSMGSYDLGGGPMYSCIPDAYRSAWNWPEHVEEKIKELNEYSAKCYTLHRELVLLGRRKLKC